MPRGCIAQAWSVAETLRSWVNTSEGQSRDRKGSSLPTFSYAIH
ncbi:MAG: hypothetical protein ACRELF_11095 [Gemmataceae bacterium]